MPTFIRAGGGSGSSANIRTGTLSLNSNWTTVYYTGFSSNPIIVANYSEQYDIGNTTIRNAIRINNITPTSVDLAIQGTNPSYFNVRWVAFQV